jgi:two-component system, OmpR family, phosphate regulon response regulator PhoB
MKTILVVDDEEPFRRMVATMLGNEGYKTIEADNGLSAFELAKTNLPDLILSDVLMYNASGFMLREFLGRDTATATIPLILMSGKAHVSGSWGSEAQIEYLQKPFSREQLIAAMSQILNRMQKAH